MANLDEIRRAVIDLQVLGLREGSGTPEYREREENIRKQAATLLARLIPERSYDEHYAGPVVCENGRFSANVTLISRLRVAVEKHQRAGTPTSEVRDGPKNQHEERLRRRIQSLKEALGLTAEEQEEQHYRPTDAFVSQRGRLLADIRGHEDALCAYQEVLDDLKGLLLRLDEDKDTRLMGACVDSELSALTAAAALRRQQG
ncbi:hypothetical protein GMRT_12360 [Giardia muris]|uniref:Uncharacterized protein n=1 Tax=Giardia muris TaxID=5742 RepID=A0A4Z1SNE1_GIAMU|nr:hypothetical protein GMRT_12360 [Giardia muris]|eukprot:TNJ27284.1 hypothetical protein GMRT_12360 [Giardia muris]